jgi:hypothetical protein
MSVMYVATLDILTEKGGFNPEAARAIGEAIELEIARSRETSATKEDVSECRSVLRDEIGVLRADTDRNFAAMRSELKEAISGLRAELKQDMSELRAEIKVSAQTTKAELIRWVFVFVMGQFAMLLGVLYFFVRYLK